MIQAPNKYFLSVLGILDFEMLKKKKIKDFWPQVACVLAHTCDDSMRAYLTHFRMVCSFLAF